MNNLPSIPDVRLVGSVAVVGRPNSGKSSFVNTLIGEKVSIVSKRPQTTQRTTHGIYTTNDLQIVFLDTAGIHLGNDRWNEAVNRHAAKSLERASVILYFIDRSRPYGTEERNIRTILDKVDKPIIPVLTKCDLDKRLDDGNIPENAIEMSNVDKSGFESIIEAIRPHLETAPLLYDEDYYTDQDMYTRVSEVVREKLFRELDEELPYSVYVETQHIQDSPDGARLDILAYIYAERDSQKAIIIGKNASFLVKIGTAARRDLEEIFGRHVMLQLRVKTMPKWKKNDKIMEGLLE
ncbi:MAG TPA: GTPase Era [bacterium]|nr:GTPase Era [bacterium]